MARLTRRGFVQASSALAAAPALAAIAAHAQGPAAPDTGNLRVEKDIVFGKGGSMDLTLDVYQPPAGVTPKRMAIIHLFGGGFFVGNKNAGYIINDAKALGARGYTNISANYRLQTQGSWPAQIHDVKAAIRWTRANAARLGIDANRIAVAGYSAGGMLSLMAAGTNGKKEFEGDGGNAGVSSDVNASIGVYPLASAQTAGGLFPAGPGHAREHRGGVADDVHQRHVRADDLHSRHQGRDDPGAVERGLLHQAPWPRRSVNADADSGRRPCVRQQRARRRRGDGGIDRSLPRSAAAQSEAVSLVRWRGRRPGRPRRAEEPRREAGASSPHPPYFCDGVSSGSGSAELGSANAFKVPAAACTTYCLPLLP